MARKQSATIWFQGNPHKEIYFQGHYHDKMYIGNQLVWEKLDESNNKLSMIYDTAYNNEYYAYGRIQERDPSTTNGYKDTYRFAIAKYNFRRRVYEKICHVSNNSFYNNVTGMIAFDEGFIFKINQNSAEFYKFCDKEGTITDLPSDNVEFATAYNYTPASMSGKVFTNKGIIDFKYTVGFVYKDYDGNTLSSIPYKFDDYTTNGYLTTYNGAIYACVYKKRNGYNAYMLEIGTLTVESEDIKFSVLNKKVYTEQPYFLKSTLKYGIVIGFKKVEKQDNGLVYQTGVYMENINLEKVYEIDMNVYLQAILIYGETEDTIISAARLHPGCHVKVKEDGEEIIHDDIRYSSSSDMQPIYILHTDETGKEHLFFSIREIYEDGTIGRASNFIEE